MDELPSSGEGEGTGESLADLAPSFLRQLEGDYPYLAEHVEQHIMAGDDGPFEFEFGLDPILDGLGRARDAGG